MSLLVQQFRADAPVSRVYAPLHADVQERNVNWIRRLNSWILHRIDVAQSSQPEAGLYGENYTCARVPHNPLLLYRHSHSWALFNHDAQLLP